MAEPSHMFSKIVQSGEVVEAYIYSNSIKVGHKREHEVGRRKKSDLDDEGLEKRSDSMYRSRREVRRLIWSNQGKYTKFITLTYKETELDVDRVGKHIKSFVKAMRRKGYDMKYLGVLEHQTARGEKEGNEGSWHIHMVLFIEEFIPKEVIEKCWPHGFVDINAIDDVRNLGAYVCKYITKENNAEFGKHVYFVSRGLKRPEEERFYTEGFSDSMTGVFPKKILQGLDVNYHDTISHDFLDDQGVAHSQKVAYKSIATTIDELLTWFEDQKAAGTPVTVVYPIREEYEENVSNEYITYFDWSQTNVTYDLATSVGVSSAVKVDKDTVHLYGTPVSQFNVMLSFLNNGKYFVLQQGNTYKFSIALEAQSSESYKKLKSVMIRFFLLDSDGTQGVTLDQPGYIDGDKISFDWKYTADKGSICKSIRLQFTADNYYTDWNLELKKGQVELYDPNKEIVDGIGDKLDEQTEKQKGFFERLGDRIKGFFDDLLEGIKNLFIPSGEYISEFFSDWNTWFADHFGILYYPFEFFIDILTRLLNLNIPDNPSITFPGVSIMGYTLWDDTTYSFDLSALPALAALHETYYIVVDVIVIVSLVHFAKKKLDSIMSGG